MKIRKSCNCRSENLTKETLNDFLFFELQQANKYGKDRHVVLLNGEISSLAVGASKGFKIYALIKSGSKSINEIEHYESIL